MPGSETLRARRFLEDVVQKVFMVSKSWSVTAQGNRVWELCEIIRNFEADCVAAISTDEAWNPLSQRPVRSALVNLERFGRLYAQQIFRQATAALQQFDARMKVEQAENFDPTL